MNRLRHAKKAGRHREAAHAIITEYTDHPVSTLIAQFVGSVFMSSFIELGLMTVEPNHEFELILYAWTVPLGMAGLWTWDGFRYVRRKALAKHHERYL